MNLLKSMKNIYFVITSQKGINITIFVLTLFILSFLLTSRYYLFQNVIENGISKKDIVATKTIKVIDIEKTEKRKRELARKVEPILTPAQDEYIKRNLNDSFDAIEAIRKTSSPVNSKVSEVRTFLDITELNYINSTVSNYLVKTSNDNFKKIKEGSKESLDLILSRGISEVELSGSIDQIISQTIPTRFTSTQKLTMTVLIKHILVPNMVIDELATEIAQKNAVNNIKPIWVTFKKGEPIVMVNEYVSRVQKDALKQAGYNISELNYIGILSILAFVGICMLSLVYYLIFFDPKYLTPSYLSLMSLLTIAVVAGATVLPKSVPVYIIPFPAIAILLTIFTNARIALLTALLTVFMIGVSFQYDIDAMTVFVIGLMIATFTSNKVNYFRRMDLVRTGLDISLIQVLVLVSVFFFQNNIENVDWNLFSVNLSLAFISGLVSGVIALGTIPLIESAFKIITPYGLAELADHNQILLRRLQFEAPGTYHHSLLVSNLAEAAAEAIGANPILARVGAFYHDIGKLKRPLFFVENQSYFGIENPHEKLNPRLSKMVITAHPKDGLELAKEYKLPVVIHQFILQHHGDGLASYFYNLALKEEGAENISEEQFRYTCPKPSTKETAILMLADASESAVRSLKNPSLEEIDEIINKIIKERFLDGQLSESPLTLKDLKTIAATFNRILRGMQHHRIKYHENMLEELENKTKVKTLKIKLAKTTENLEQEFAEEFDKEKDQKKNA